MAFKKQNLYLQFILLSLIIYLSSESELKKIKERRELQNDDPVVFNPDNPIIINIPGSSTSSNTPSSSTSSTSNTGNTTETSTINYPTKRKSSSGSLSSGAIVGIVIPCIGALLGAGILAALCRAAPTPPMQHGIPMDMHFMDTSVEKFQPPVQEQVVVQQPPQQVIVQQEEVPQPVQIVQQPVTHLVQQPVTTLVQQPVTTLVQQPVTTLVQQPVTLVQEPVTTLVQQPVAIAQETATTVVQQPGIVVHQAIP
jgi:hypothetical protein